MGVLRCPPFPPRASRRQGRDRRKRPVPVRRARPIHRQLGGNSSFCKEGCWSFGGRRNSRPLSDTLMICTHTLPTCCCPDRPRAPDRRARPTNTLITLTNTLVTLVTYRCPDRNRAHDHGSIHTGKICADHGRPLCSTPRGVPGPLFRTAPAFRNVGGLPLHGACRLQGPSLDLSFQPRFFPFLVELLFLGPLLLVGPTKKAKQATRQSSSCVLISHEVFIKLFCKSPFPHKSVNVFFI